jgi:hypothetical protein
LKEERLRLVITFAVSTGSAALVAYLLGYVAHYDFGLSRVEIRDSAFGAAVLILMVLARSFLMRHWHKPK